MADFWGEILKFFGQVLSAIYSVVPSYGVAIILLTIITRAIIAPLGVKQIRSMQKMQKLQPEIKKLQQKYKGDRQKLNEEMMKLYKEHGANPLGGCFPLIAQMPVFIALYAVIRAATPIGAVPATELAAGSLPKDVICRPNVEASANGAGPTAIVCQTPDGPQTIEIGRWVSPETERDIEAPPWLARCTPNTVEGRITFGCTSALGTGHLPKDDKLFRDITADRAEFLGMHLACSPNEAGTDRGIRRCTSRETDGGGAQMIVYYLLVVAMAGTTYIQQRQMLKKSPQGAAAQQMKIMATVMPLVFGFLSLQFQAALSLYWVTGNVWTIGQQKFILGREDSGAPTPPAKPEPTPKPNSQDKKAKQQRPGQQPPRGGKKGKKGRR